LSYQVADALCDGRLVTVLDEFELPASPVHLLHREGRHASKKVRGFLDLAIERLRSNQHLHQPPSTPAPDLGPREVATLQHS
jgi:DNA-binding transcriptional LysR family regulator